LSRRDEPLALAPWGEEAVGSNGLVNDLNEAQGQPALA